MKYARRLPSLPVGEVVEAFATEAFASAFASKIGVDLLAMDNAPSSSQLSQRYRFRAEFQLSGLWSPLRRWVPTPCEIVWEQIWTIDSGTQAKATMAVYSEQVNARLKGQASLTESDSDVAFAFDGRADIRFGLLSPLANSGADLLLPEVMRDLTDVLELQLPSR